MYDQNDVINVYKVIILKYADYVEIFQFSAMYISYLS